MKQSWKIYLFIALVFIAAFIWSIFFPPESIARQILTIPGAAALVAALFQLVRNETKYQKESLIQEAKQEFDLAITSHMANAAFDKHSAFCEEYIAEFQKAMITIYRTGGSQEIIEHASKLHEVQKKHRAWLTKEIEESLAPFENALRKIGAAHRLYNKNPELANSSGKMQEAYDLTSDIFGLKQPDKDQVDDAIRDTELIQKIRRILGMEKLTNLIQKQLGTH